MSGDWPWRTSNESPTRWQELRQLCWIHIAAKCQNLNIIDAVNRADKVLAEYDNRFPIRK